MVMASATIPGGTPNGCLRDHSASHTGATTHATFRKPARREPFLASDDPSPLAGVQLVRPRRYAAAGAPAGRRQHGEVTRAATRKIPENSHAQPGNAIKSPGQNFMPS